MADVFGIEATPMLMNRDELIAMLFRETDRAQRMKTPLAVISCGIGNWLEWRSQCTPGTLKVAFLEIAGRIERLLRCYDSVGQMADGELVLILPGCNSLHAALMAERLNGEVFQVPVARGEGQVQFTACFGVAASGGRSPLVVLREAEQALMLAKTRGAGAVERNEADADPDPSVFIPVIEDEALHW
jgi:two-component system cell cycle response regulator